MSNPYKATNALMAWLNCSVLLKLRLHHAALHLAALAVVKAFEHAADVFVAIEVTAALSGCEVDFGSGCQKFLQLSAAFSRPC